MAPCVRCIAVFVGFLLVLTACLDVSEKAKELAVNSGSKENSVKLELVDKSLRWNEEDCGAQWKMFTPQSDLNSSQVIHSWHRQSPHDFFEFKHGLQKTAPGVGLIVFPELNFAFCMIPSVTTSTLWSVVLDDMSSSQGGPVDHFKLQAPQDPFKNHSQQWLSPIDVSNMFSQENATRIVFVREPLLRFASAFLELCFVDDNARAACSAMFGVPDESITMKHVVEGALKGEPFMDLMDFAPQSSFCELRQRINEYTFIGLVSHHSFVHDSSCILDNADLGRYDAWRNGALLSNDEKTHKELSIDEVLLEKIFTQDAARSLIELYATDYNTFHFPQEPDWVSNAHGEFYDVPVTKIIHY